MLLTLTHIHHKNNLKMFPTLIFGPQKENDIIFIYKFNIKNMGSFPSKNWTMNDNIFHDATKLYKGHFLP